MRLRHCALLLALFATPLAAQGAPPWKEGDAPPVLLGLHLGDSKAKLDSVMGRAEGTQSLGEGAEAYLYRGGKVGVGWASLDGVAMIDLRHPDAGALDGFRVGDSIESLVAKWGKPPQGEGNVGLWVFGWWAVVVRSDDQGQRITMITLGRVAQ